MKKVGIVTIVDDYNFGNRLQNYALQTVINKLGCKCVTINNHPILNSQKKYFLRIIKYNIFKVKDKFKKNKRRLNSFRKFNEYIKFSDKLINAKNYYKLDYDYFVVGSDQIWNPNLGGLKDLDLLKRVESQKRISYAASFGISSIDKQYYDVCKKEFNKFKKISVREDKGKEIIEELTKRSDIETLIDPTLLLSSSEWEKLAIKPRMLNSENYILIYFLGNLSSERYKKIENIAIENNCKIINLLDKKSAFYECGPSEFLYLEKNAFLVCTDSFHSSVFAFLFDRPFIIFEREGDGTRMNSRLETLLNKFQLKNRLYNGEKISSENLNHDYSHSYKLLSKEIEKSILFLEDALDVKGCD